MNRKIFSYILAIGFVFVFAGLSRGYPLTAALNAMQVVPESFSAGRGSCKITATDSDFGPFFDIRCDFSGLSGGLINASIRTATVGQNGEEDCWQKDAWVTLPNNGSGTVWLSCRHELMPAFSPSIARFYYIVLQTVAYPEGEVRGQLKPIRLDGDVDGEGRTEISIFRPSDGYTYAYCSLNDSTLKQHLVWNQQTDSEPFLADFDGDAIADWSFIRTEPGTGRMITISHRSKDNQVYYYPYGNISFGDIPAYGDYDGDGRIEHAVFRSNEGIFYVDRVGRFNWGIPGDKPCPGDYDGDGKTDVCVTRVENNQLVWYISRSSDGQYRRTPWGLPTDEVYPASTTDFDGDGLNDLLVSRIESGQRVFYVLRSADESWFVLSWGLATDKVKIGDYDGDGASDFASIREENNQLVWYINQGTNGTRVVYWGLSGDK